MKIAPKDAAPASDAAKELAMPDTAAADDLADHRDAGVPDAAVEAIAEVPPPDTARDSVPPPADFAVEARASDLPLPDGGDANGAADAAGDAPGDGAGRDASVDTTVDATIDATVDTSSPIDGGLLAFCTGDSPRAVVNGAALTPVVGSQRLVMDCCDGGRFVITNAELAAPIGVSWLLEAASSSSLPATIDLANPPSGWRVEVLSGCSVTSAACLGPLDLYQTGLVGWLTVARDASGKLDMSVCVHVEEKPGDNMYFLHSLDFYATHILTW